MYFCPQGIILIVCSWGIKSSEIKWGFFVFFFLIVPIIMGLYNQGRKWLGMKIGRHISHNVKWLFLKSFSAGVQLKGFKAAECSGNPGFFHSVNAFWLKGTHSHRYLIGTGERACHLHAYAWDFSNVVKLSVKGFCKNCFCSIWYKANNLVSIHILQLNCRVNTWSPVALFN